MGHFKHTRYLPPMMAEAAAYRVLRQVYKSDPQLGPNTVDLLRECFKAHRDDGEVFYPQERED
jgi:hypothetical protein